MPSYFLTDTVRDLWVDAFDLPAGPASPPARSPSGPCAAAGETAST